MPSPQEEVALSLTIGLSVPSQLVRGELEYLQQDVWWRDTKPSGPVHAASPLQSRAGLSQPVPTACPCQPTGLPPPELPSHLECWALGRGTLSRVDMGGWWQGPSYAPQSWVFTRPCRACGPSLSQQGPSIPCWDLRLTLPMQCSRTCGKGWKKRSVACKSTNPSARAQLLPDTLCSSEPKPRTHEACPLKRCYKHKKLQWLVSAWSQVRAPGLR